MKFFEKIRTLVLPALALALCCTMSALMGCGGGGGGGGGGSAAPASSTARLANKTTSTKSSSGMTFVLSYNGQGNGGTYTGDVPSSPSVTGAHVAGAYSVLSYSESGHTATLVLGGTTVTESNPPGATPENVKLNGTYTITWNADFTSGTWTSSNGYSGTI